MYKQIKFGNEVINTVVRTEDGVNIPFEPANTDYQAYLRWLEEGNTPEPAEDQQNN